MSPVWVSLMLPLRSWSVQWPWHHRYCRLGALCAQALASFPKSSLMCRLDCRRTWLLWVTCMALTSWARPNFWSYCSLSAKCASFAYLPSDPTYRSSCSLPKATQEYLKHRRCTSNCEVYCGRVTVFSDLQAWASEQALRFHWSKSWASHSTQTGLLTRLACR